MITFNCPHCNRGFAIADKYGGKNARCKACGSSLIVPSATPEAASVAAPQQPTKTSQKIVIFFGDTPSARESQNAPAGRTEIQRPMERRLPMRIRRMMADAEYMNKLFRNFPLIRIVSMNGNPPDKYRIEYNIQGVARGNDGQPVYRDQHLVEIQLTSDYPRQSPKCRILTPIFHPNFDPTIICVGDHWTAAEKLADLVIRIGEMIAYQAYNIKSPLDGEAAMWADLNQTAFPIDKRSLMPPEL